MPLLDWMLMFVLSVCIVPSLFSFLLQSVVKLCFYERKLQVQELEKYEEWKNNRPADRILEIGKDNACLVMIDIENNSFFCDRWHLCVCSHVCCVVKWLPNYSHPIRMQYLIGHTGFTHLKRERLPAGLIFCPWAFVTLYVYSAITSKFCHICIYVIILTVLVLQMFQCQVVFTTSEVKEIYSTLMNLNGIPTRSPNFMSL